MRIDSDGLGEIAGLWLDWPDFILFGELTSKFCRLLPDEGSKSELLLYKSIRAFIGSVAELAIDCDFFSMSLAPNNFRMVIFSFSSISRLVNCC